MYLCNICVEYKYHFVWILCIFLKSLLLMSIDVKIPVVNQDFCVMLISLLERDLNGACMFNSARKCLWEIL